MRDRSGAKAGYVSEHLTHFVGRSKPEADQYALLRRILERRWLLHSPFEERPTLGIAIYPDRLLSKNDMLVPDMICFCDIPIDHLGIHTQKYSRFGVAFPRHTLVARGASPVMYVAANSAVLVKKPEYRRPPDKESITPEEYEKRKAEPLKEEEFHREPKGALLDSYMEGFWSAWQKKEPFEKGSAGADVAETLQKEKVSVIFLLTHLFGFLKVFDAALPADHPDNYYMEREWRLYGNLHFESGEVSQVIVPPEYVERCRSECPEYAARVIECPSDGTAR